MDRLAGATRWLMIGAVAFAPACATRQPDTQPPEAEQPLSAERDTPPPSESAAVATAPTQDCTVERVAAALDQSVPWTADEGRTCLEALRPSCDAGDGAACYASALIGFSGAGGATPDRAAAGQRYGQACEHGVAEACRDLAWFVRDGIVGTGDPSARKAEAFELLSKACDLGDGKSCTDKDKVRPEPPKVEAPPLVVVEGANANSLKSNADGVEIEELRCAVARPLFGIIAVTGALSKRKKAFDRCVPGGGAFVAYFEFAKGKTKNVRVDGGTAAQNRCVTKALTPIKPPMDARCGAVILVGESEGAHESLEALRSAAQP